MRVPLNSNKITEELQMANMKTLPESTVSPVLFFRCPKCQGEKVKEIAIGRGSTLITKVFMPGGEVIPGDQDFGDCKDVWYEYECDGCGYFGDMLEWVRDRGLLYGREFVTEIYWDRKG
jgi:hypothetical protein